MSGAKTRVVGKDANSPGFNDAIFAIAFLAHVIFIVVVFFMWVGDSAPWFPSNETHTSESTWSNTTVDGVGGATSATFGYTLLFSTIWVFIYLGVMRVAALALIVVLNLLLVAIWIGFGLFFLFWATSCKDRSDYPGACTDGEQIFAYIGAIMFAALAALHLAWLCCVRDRIILTAKMLKAVATVLSTCPGTILVSYIAAVVSLLWSFVWMGAYIETNIWLAGGKDEEATWDTMAGPFVGLMFGMFISFFWGYKVISTISSMTTSHVVASWYFDPEGASSGIPCCKPVTLVGLKRAMTNYLGSIAFGTLIVAILEAIYYTAKYVANKMAGGNLVLKLVVCCFLCILNCLKNTIEWLTEWAYAYIALYGSSFIEAGSSVFSMLGSSGMGALAQSTLVAPVLLMGRLIGGAVGVGAGMLSLQFFTIDHAWSQPFIGFFLGYAITAVALSCVEAGNKMIFVCYADAPEFMLERVPEISETLSGGAAKAPPPKAGTTSATASGDVELTVRP